MWNDAEKDGGIQDPRTVFDDHPFVGVDYVTTGKTYRFSSGTTLQEGDLVSECKGRLRALRPPIFQAQAQSDLRLCFFCKQCITCCVAAAYSLRCFGIPCGTLDWAKSVTRVCDRRPQ